MNKEQLGSFIGNERKARGLTQRELAERLHVTDKAVSKWERGLSYPDVTLLEPLAAALDLGVEELMACRRRETREEDETVTNLLAISQDSVRRERRRSWRRLGAVLALLAALAAMAAAVVWSRAAVSEETQTAIVLKETEDGGNYIYVEYEGRLRKLLCGENVDFDAIQLKDARGEERVYQLSYTWNRLTRTGTVSSCELTGAAALGGIMDAQFDEGEGPLFGLPTVYRMSENYYPNPHGEGYLCDYVCWVLLDEETWETERILTVEDCVSATPWDLDGDGVNELAVRTRWPEKPYIVYDMADGEITETWPDTMPAEVRETLAGLEAP